MATPPFRVKALHEYASKEEDDLNFPSGQIMTVTDVEDADWYFGEYADAAGYKQEGLFPKNFVKMFEPETPPRPSRTSKSKKELDPMAPTDNTEKGPNIEETGASLPAAVPVPSQPEQMGVPDQRHGEPRLPSVRNFKSEPASAAPPASTATNPPPLAVSKPAVAPTAEKPVSGSFRDRINAFNKSTAPPVAPMKPSGLGSSSGSGFVKKPFVAPPPSKNAYVPPPRETPIQKVYRREEDPELLTQGSKIMETEEQSNQPKVTPLEIDEEDQPKPTSLKDRIALLQKQQMEQAARHGEGGQMKEKPKRPSRKQVEAKEHSADQEDDLQGKHMERVNSGENTEKRSMDLSRAAPPPLPRSNTRPRKSREATPLGSPVEVPLRDLLSDPNDADQSGVGDTEEGEELSTGRDDSDEKPRHKGTTPLTKAPQAPVHEADVGDEEDNAEEHEVEEADEGEDEVDPEVKRRMEIRERMAKMSGGMGMAGMFGPSGGIPSRSPMKQSSASSDRKASGNSTSGPTDDSANRAPPVSIVPMPGLSKVRSPEQSETRPEITKEEGDVPRSIVQRQDPEAMYDIEDMQDEPMPLPLRSSTERSAPPPVPQARSAAPLPSQGRATPPPLPPNPPIAPPSRESRPIPPPHLTRPRSPSEGSKSDDEMSIHRRSSLTLPPEPDSRPSSRGGPPSVPLAGPPPSLPSRPMALPSRPSDFGSRSPQMPSTEMSPTSPTVSSASGNRGSRIPPIPGSSPAMPSAPQNRAPPPPPPSNAPPPRVPDGDGRAPPIPPPNPRSPGLEDSEEEITEYEGDYDTDIASSADHKDALKSHAKGSSLEHDSTMEIASLHHSGLPSLGPVLAGAPRAIPPPLPSQSRPRTTRQSSDMPRGAPPPPPPPRDQGHEEGNENEDYDPYKYTKSDNSQPLGSHYDTESPIAFGTVDPDPVLSASPSQRYVSPPTAQGQSQYAHSPNMSIPSRSGTGNRQSIDVQRSSTTIRRSTDGPRPSGEQGFIASDVDMGQGSQWWARPDTPPPVFQNRRDLIYEMEETSTTRRGGKQAITKVVYVLFMDYSQTVITVHFETNDPANASLEQRHEPPPQNLRQDQLENAHATFGSRIAEAAATKEGSMVGDGSPSALVLDLLSALPDALLPVGVRAFGALVYANLANASVRQFDEIRPGDIVTFRNARFQGHRGAMHSKYSNEVGKPDHVGVVIDWDGTKKKVRAWEQGRESRKVKGESFKLGDMRSGEVKVWRVMARSWVGWDGQN